MNTSTLRRCAAGALMLGTALIVSACGSSPSGPSGDDGSAGAVDEIIEIGTCDLAQGAAHDFLGTAADVTGTGRSCTYFLPEQVEIAGETFWRDVHFETIPFDWPDGVSIDDLPLISDLVEAGGLSPQEPPAGWTFAGDAPGKLDYVLVASNGMALHCDASTQPGGASAGATPPAIDSVALLAFCEEIRDLAIEHS